MEEIIKQQLIKKVFEKAKTESFKKTKNSLSDYLSVCFEEKYGHRISERTLVRYYDYILLEKKPSYFIDEFNLNVFSEYLGYKNYKYFYDESNDFFLKVKPEEDKTTIHNEQKWLKKISEKRYQYAFLSIILAFGFWLLKADGSDKQNIVPEQKIKIAGFNDSVQNKISSEPIQQKTKNHPVYVKSGKLEKTEISEVRKKECMYWDGNRYEEVFCDEWVDGKTIIAINKDIKLLRKINSPDTLTEENALGKVWYIKSNNKVEFFTHYGIHPENGKTLKPITRYIIKKYIQE